MRSIGELDSEAKAQRFSDFLFVQDIPNEVDPGAGNSWVIWVHSDDDLAKAAEYLAAFRANPDDKQFAAAAAKANDLREQKERELKEYQARVKGPENLFRRFVTYQVGPLTALLIGACIVVCFWTSWGVPWNEWGRAAWQRAPFLFFSESMPPATLLERMFTSPEIRSGEIWRLVSPMLIHFHILHILFNMLWLRDLGGMIETVEGTGKLLLLVLASAAFSNWAQYSFGGHPVFGGMSGVVYALLGYVWMKGKYHPGSGLYLHKDTVMMMLAWLVLGFLNLVPFVKMANWAHLGGLVVGVCWGYLGTRRV